MSEKDTTFSDSLKSASAWGLVVVVLILAFFLKDILITFIAAVIFAIALDKPIDKLVKRKVNRSLAVICIYVAFLAIIAFLSYSFIPPLTKQIGNFSSTLPSYVDKLFYLEGNNQLSSPSSSSIVQGISAFSDIIGAGSETIFGQIFIIFGGFASFLVIFFVAFFLNIQKDGVRNLIDLAIPKKNISYANSFFNKIQDSLNGWLWGKTVSSIIVAIIIYLGLLLIGIPYALVFAVVAFILNYIPYLGPTIASIIPAFVGFANSFFDGAMVFALYFVVNGIIESFVLLPYLMKKAINMNPVLLILFVLVGGKLAGVLGIIISIPIAAVMSLIVGELIAGKREFSSEKN